MNMFLKRTFGSLERSYLIRQYVFGAIPYVLLAFQKPPFGVLVYMTACLILYPFAMFVYDSIMGMLMGDRLFITSIIFTVAWAIFKVILIFMLSVCIAPLGILYLFFTNRNME